MDPLTAAAIGGGLQAGLGVYQMAKGAQMEKEAGAQPLYQIPDEVYQALSVEQRAALEGLPAEQKKQFVDNLMAMQSTGLNQMSSLKSGLKFVGDKARTVTQGFRDLLTMDAEARQRNQQLYTAGLRDMAGYQDLAYQTNELQPWQREVEYGRALQGAGLQQLGGASNTLLETATYTG